MKTFEQAMEEYHNARTLLIKSLRRMDYRINKLYQIKLGLLPYKYTGQKNVKELRRVTSSQNKSA